MAPVAKGDSRIDSGTIQSALMMVALTAAVLFIFIAIPKQEGAGYGEESLKEYDHVYTQTHAERFHIGLLEQSINKNQDNTAAGTGTAAHMHVPGPLTLQSSTTKKSRAQTKTPLISRKLLAVAIGLEPRPIGSLPPVCTRKCHDDCLTCVAENDPVPLMVNTPPAYEYEHWKCVCQDTFSG